MGWFSSKKNKTKKPVTVKRWIVIHHVTKEPLDTIMEQQEGIALMQMKEQGYLDHDIRNSQFVEATITYTPK
jgi:hypothetical protein